MSSSIGINWVVICLVVFYELVKPFLINYTVGKSLQIHDSSLAIPQTLLLPHRHLLNAVQLGGRTQRDLDNCYDIEQFLVELHLSSVVRSEIEWRTVALRENSFSVLPGETVFSVLLHLTVSHLLAQSYKLLTHLDLLDVTKTVVTLAMQDYRHGVCE